MSRHLNIATAHRTADTTLEQAPVDMARLQEMVGDEPADVRRLVDLYLAEAQKVMGALRAAVAAGAAPEVERLAHKLGGSSAMCGMIGMVDPLREMERSGRAGSDDTRRILQEAELQMNRIGAYLTAHALKEVC